MTPYSPSFDVFWKNLKSDQHLSLLHEMKMEDWTGKEFAPIKYLLFLLSKPSAISHIVCLRLPLKSQEIDKGADMYETTHSRVLLAKGYVLWICVLLSAVTHSAIRLSKEGLLHSRPPQYSHTHQHLSSLSQSRTNLFLFLYLATACRWNICMCQYLCGKWP